MLPTGHSRPLFQVWYAVELWAGEWLRLWTVPPPRNPRQVCGWYQPCQTPISEIVVGAHDDAKMRGESSIIIL